MSLRDREVVDSCAAAGRFAVMISYPVEMYDEILSYYPGWVGRQDTTTLNETKSTNPRCDDWIGEIGPAASSCCSRDRASPVRLPSVFS